jgi:hypothetical protein
LDKIHSISANSSASEDINSISLEQVIKKVESIILTKA